MTYAVTTFPFRAAVGLDSPLPARFLAGMVEQQLRYGHPSRRRGGAVWSWVARRGVPKDLVAKVLCRPGRQDRGDLDVLLSAVRLDWPRLAAISPLLPRRAPDLSALAVKRSVGETVFVFGEARHPLVVLKPGDVEREVRALGAAAPSGVVPRPLGTVGGLAAQEGRPGAPPRLPAITPSNAASLPRSAEFDLLAGGLCAVAAATVRTGASHEIGDAVELAAAEVGGRAGDLVRAAGRDVAALDVSVLRHGDLSGQNWLVEGSRLSGVVDWETAVMAGVPGFDTWHAAMSWFEQGVGLAKWSTPRVAASFARAWDTAPYFAGAREAARRTAAAAGVPERSYDALEVAFFARRLGQRLRDPGRYTLEPAAAAAMLRTVCA